MRDISKYKGCLIGGAIGDALGYAVEFTPEDEIFQQYGPLGITRYDLSKGKAIISDDTQMTLFTAAGLLNGQAQGKLYHPGANVTECIRQAYLDWYLTQTETFPLPEDKMKKDFLLKETELFARRAPGNTCMTALSMGGTGAIEVPVNHSKGCGGVMRVAPIGLYFIDCDGWTVEDIDLLGAQAAAITHGHELGYIPSAALVHIVYLLASGQKRDVLSAVRDSLSAMQRIFPGSKEMGYIQAIMQTAIMLAQSDMDDLSAIHKIGGGWVAEETLAIAVYCALKYQNDFEKAIIASANHSGDSDSTGAVTGNILGAYLGYDAIPEVFLQDLELKDLTLEVADELCDNAPQEHRYCSVRMEYEENKNLD